MAYFPRVLLAAAALQSLVALAPAQDEVQPPVFSMIGSAAIGSACLIDVVAPQDQGMHYAIVLSMSNIPTPLPDGNVLPITVDQITHASVTPGNGLLHGNVAALHRGKGQALMTIPYVPAAVGLRLYAAAFTWDPSGQGPLIRTMVPTTLAIDILPR